MDDDMTVWCGNLSDKATEELIYELFLQVGPIDAVRIPKDREGKQMNYAFISFDHLESVTYAQQAMNGIRLFNRNLIVKPRTVKETVQSNENVQESNDEICSPIVQHVEVLPELSYHAPPVIVQAVEEPQLKPMSAPEVPHEFKERGRSNYNYQQRNDYGSYRKNDHDHRNRGPSNIKHNYNKRGNYPARRGKYRPY